VLIAGAKIGCFLVYPRHFLKINSYLHENNIEIMILTVDIGNTRIKAAVLRRISFWIILFYKMSFKKH
jgi:type III pantothenate kinase